MPDDDEQRRARAVALMDAKFGAAAKKRDSCNPCTQQGDVKCQNKHVASPAEGGRGASFRSPGAFSRMVQGLYGHGMYEPLPPELAVRSGAVEHDEETGQGQKQMLLKQIVDELAGALSSNVYESKVENKVLNLGGGGDSARRAWKRSSKEVKPLKGSRRANAGCHKRDVRRMVVGDGKYGGLLPLNDLWHDHVNAVANRKNTAPIKQAKLFEVVQAIDLRGAMLKLVKSMCSSSLHLEGIVARETHGTFVIVCKDGAVRKLPKKGSVFNLVLHGVLFSLEGGCMIGRRV